VILERLIAAGQRLVTDAEVLQEILHRYVAIEKREAIGPALQVTLDIVDEVFPIGKTEVQRAGEIARNPALLSARDAVHIAVMERYGIRSILSFDGDFDRWPGFRGSTGSEWKALEAVPPEVGERNSNQAQSFRVPATVTPVLVELRERHRRMDHMERHR
jgi:hypothetical protein